VVFKYRQYVLSFRRKARVACDRQTRGRTDSQNYDSQNRASIAASRGKQKSVNTDPGTRGPRDNWDDTALGDLIA